MTEDLVLMGQEMAPVPPSFKARFPKVGLCGAARRSGIWAWKPVISLPISEGARVERLEKEGDQRGRSRLPATDTVRTLQLFLREGVQWRELMAGTGLDSAVDYSISAYNRLHPRHRKQDHRFIKTAPYSGYSRNLLSTVGR